MTRTGENSSETNRLLGLCREGDASSLGKLLSRHRGPLRHLIAHRLDARLRGRIDPSDVVQEAHVAASGSLEAYLREPRSPLVYWLLGIASHKILELRRFHLGTSARDPRREVPIHRPEAAVVPGLGTPSEAAMRVEEGEALHGALDRLEPSEREILLLRHFGHMTNAQVAEILGISSAAAGKRYLRALGRLRDLLGPRS
ncbi:sigma-70 family RNA polymerase sigma factor [Paludisphaera mucosa]|uniref:Sigma-70 family RNA polymerase sigma factor n=1 Tax=Paludisphaera mucosa TaxID=3030827 RepID=A0ABT6FLH5_9BACT|nr:sigma-70 family RNA polymerase sigma factor [Paludisphaera mucosa]MDG3008218.1 sigma-70 family RNA polymerase sigma factor [Paludisphaera mucosa]